MCLEGFYFTVHAKTYGEYLGLKVIGSSSLYIIKIFMFILIYHNLEVIICQDNY